MQSMLQDVRYALRQLRNSPGFTITAVLTLALGIGANSVIFAVAKQLLLDKLAVLNPDQLRLFTIVEGPKTAINDMWGDFYPNAAGQMTTTSISYPVYQQMRRKNHSLQDLFAFKDLGGNDRLTVKVDGSAETASGELVSGNYYDQLGVRPALGRAIQPSDDAAPGAGAVAVISDGYWASRFARSPAVLGKVIEVNFTPVTIVGVNPPRFTGAKQAQISPDLFIPFSMQPVIVPKGDHSLLTDPDLWWMQVMGRMKADVPERQAQAVLADQLDEAARATMTIGKGEDTAQLLLANGSRGLAEIGRQFAQPIHVLLALVGVVLLLACANLANLLLARSASRQREMSVRLALGASRTRILRQVFTESLLLSVLGGAAGAILGYSLRNSIPRLLTASWQPAIFYSRFDWPIFAFTAGITLISGLVFGLAPAWRSSRQADVSTAIKESATSATRRRKGLAGKSLTVLQIALSLLLVVGAGLFLRTFRNLSDTPLGFRPENVLLFSIEPPRSHYPPAKRLHELRQIEEALVGLPGTTSIALSNEPLLSNGMSEEDFVPQGKAWSRGAESSAYSNRVSEKFFSTLGIPILSGRSFNEQDTETSTRVGIINQALARRSFPEGNPVGKTFKNHNVWYQIVGICGDTKYADLRSDVPPTFYLDYLQSPAEANGMTFELHTQGDTGSVLVAATGAVASVDPDLPLMDVRTQTQQISATMQQERIFASLTSGFGVLALALACIGVYGVMAYRVAQRTNEISIRLALGAQSRQVLMMVLREATWMAVIGVAAGLAAALALTRFLRSMLFELKPCDPVTLGGATALLFAVALLAGWLPAWRASRVEPMHALRSE
ncbi:MAG TPA: ABC transporter permease [Acidisarcina sp.]